MEAEFTRHQLIVDVQRSSGNTSKLVKARSSHSTLFAPWDFSWIDTKAHGTKSVPCYQTCRYSVYLIVSSTEHQLPIKGKLLLDLIYVWKTLQRTQDVIFTCENNRV